MRCLCSTSWPTPPGDILCCVLCFAYAYAKVWGGGGTYDYACVKCVGFYRNKFAKNHAFWRSGTVVDPLLAPSMSSPDCPQAPPSD